MIFIIIYIIGFIFTLIVAVPIAVRMMKDDERYGLENNNEDMIMYAVMVIFASVLWAITLPTGILAIYVKRLIQRTKNSHE